MAEDRRSVEGRYCGTLDLRTDDSPDCRAEAHAHGAGAFWWRATRDGTWILHALIPAPGRPGWCESAWPILPARLQNGSGWEWDGNVERPTLRPSLHAVGVWHGWMREGQLESI